MFFFLYFLLNDSNFEHVSLKKNGKGKDCKKFSKTNCINRKEKLQIKAHTKP
jgi:hypothetical protein